jgi:UBX domain
MTTDQAKTYQAHLTATSKSLTDRTLMTKEMRDSLALERAQKRNFNHCDIRIRFPDGMQVQGTFGAQESVGDVYDFVKSLMRQDGLGFHLSMIPILVICPFLFCLDFPVSIGPVCLVPMSLVGINLTSWTTLFVDSP